jgi:outer membrane protein assembly factor BamB
MKSRLPLLLALAFALPLSARAEDWPDFRGPTGQGLYAGKGLPIEWSTTKNVAWKETIPGKGWSSPIVQEGRVYLTTAVAADGSKDQSLRALCLDAKTGKRVWNVEVFQQDGKKAPGIHKKASHASPSPVTDGKRLYIHFGHQGTACLEFDGTIVWRNTELGYAPVHGNGGSPILVGDRLVFAADGFNKQLLIALDKNTGKLAWKTDRKSTYFKKFSFCTPIAFSVDGNPQIVCPAAGAVIAYEPKQGQELWRVQYDGYSVVPRPVYGHGMIYFSTGYDAPKLLAIRVDGKGDVTPTHVAWSSTKAAPYTPSPLLVGDELYTISDDGIASCFDAKTGKPHWQERIEGNFSASPFHAEGRIYVQSEQGVGTVLKAGRQFEQLAQNDLKEKTFASYAAADGALFIRTERHLYCIAGK